MTVPLVNVILVMTPSISAVDLNCKDVRSPVMFSETRVAMTESCRAAILPNLPVWASGS